MERQGRVGDFCGTEAVAGFDNTEKEKGKHCFYVEDMLFLNLSYKYILGIESIRKCWKTRKEKVYKTHANVN